MADVYGHAASYSYFNGCSTGGRQGYMEAQHYPSDYNGINADAPAINWNQFEVSTLWPQVVMNQTHTYPDHCVSSTPSTPPRSSPATSSTAPPTA